ncbi:MAG: DUF4835 family protein [Bacteroidales bacterium]|jgi:hypothetical protein|nr:DUF4835 family protein [Bacteroidales bacterium]
MRIIVFAIFALILSSSLKAQELNCVVQINSSQVQASDKTVFENLQKAVYEFMNNRRWSGYEFKIEEKIECSILMTISTWDNIESFTGTIQVQARRPVYNSSYSTTLINYLDKDFSFKYVNGQPLDFVENTFTNNLSSVLAYYAYLIIGLDFDTFSEYGGEEYFSKAQAVVNSAQSAPDKGWRAFENQKNRYWIVENLMNKSYQDFRSGLYHYHRMGLDLFSNDALKARAGILEGITLVQRAYRQKPGLFIVSLYMLAKSDELVNVFKPAPMVEKTKAVNILKSIDPANSAKYNKILTDN